MYFEEITKYLKENEPVRRIPWPKGVWIGLISPTPFSNITVAYFIKQNRKGDRLPYEITAEDFLANDWEKF